MRGNLSAEGIKGRQVYDSAGNELGNLEDVTLSPDALRVTGFVVKMNREAAERLHLDAPLLGSARVEIGADRLGSIGDGILLNIDQRDMATLLFDQNPR